MAYRVGIIGLGRIAYQFEEDPLMKKPCTHAGAYSSNPKTKIVAACDVIKNNLDDFTKKWDSVKPYSDYQKMLKQEKLDIVSICTHADLHAEMTISAAESGVKAIFCEKPMSTNLKDAEEMIKVCRKNGVVLAINHTKRWDPYIRKAKELLDEGRIGELKILEGHCNVGLMNAGTHLFDSLRFLAGDVDWVNGFMKPDGSTDPGGCGLLHFKNNSDAFVDSDFRNYVYFAINLIGSDGVMRIGRDLEILLPKISEHESGIKELASAGFPKAELVPPMSAAVDEILQSIENNRPPSCTGEDGKAALEIALAFHESNEKGEKVKLPLKNKDSVVIPRTTSLTKK